MLLGFFNTTLFPYGERSFALVHGRRQKALEDCHCREQDVSGALPAEQQAHPEQAPNAKAAASAEAATIYAVAFR